MEQDQSEFIYQSMLTCIGNKRKLVGNIEEIIVEISKTLGKEKLNILDGFCGSTVVSRMFSYYADILVTNDMEYYSYIMSKCFLTTTNSEEQAIINNYIRDINNLMQTGPYIEGIVCQYYAPQDTNNVQHGERCFYTRENALRIDTARKYIDEYVIHPLQEIILAALLVKASIHSNTAGVFKGFYKNKQGLGCFGGEGQNALSRIMRPIELEPILWNPGRFQHKAFNMNINLFIKQLEIDMDVIYLDPPYNQHPYGSNYFMLNTIAHNEEPENISLVSGIPKDWNKSDYNYHKAAVSAMRELLEEGLKKSTYILLSYNNEGIIKQEDWDVLFQPYHTKKYEILYDTYKGSRNLKDRSNKVVEIMYLISLPP